jgi:hypothetical protein
VVGLFGHHDGDRPGVGRVVGRKRCKLNQADFDEQLKSSIFEQRVKLAGLEAPSGSEPSVQQSVKQIVAGSFVFGFRLVMLIYAALALASALIAWWLIGKSRPVHTRQQ